MDRCGSALRQESAPWRGRIAASVLAAVAAFCLSGCGSISQKFADTASQLPAVGLPADAPARPATAVAYPAVHDIPPPRNSVVLTNTEAAQLEIDLATARDQQRTSVGLPAEKKKKKAVRPAQNSIDPAKASSASSIY